MTVWGILQNNNDKIICKPKSNNKLWSIVTHTGQEIDSAEIGDNLMLQVDVQPSSKCENDL